MDEHAQYGISILSSIRNGKVKKKYPILFEWVTESAADHQGVNSKHQSKGMIIIERIGKQRPILFPLFLVLKSAFCTSATSVNFISKTNTFSSIPALSAFCQSNPSTHSRIKSFKSNISKIHSGQFLSMSPSPTLWSDNHDAIERCVPPLSSTSYKGSSGRVGVLGGSARYTGAPYYAAMASLKAGKLISCGFF